METLRPTDIALHIRLRPEGTPLDAHRFIHVFDALETAMYVSDRQDIEHAAAALQIPPHIRDASLERLRHYRHHRLLLTDAHPGSIELFGLVAGVAYFVLEKTIGEAFREGFKDSGCYTDLRNFFRSHIDQKARLIAEGARKALGSKNDVVTVEVVPRTSNSPNIVTVDIIALPEKRDVQRPAPLGKELDKKQA